MYDAKWSTHEDDLGVVRACLITRSINYPRLLLVGSAGRLGYVIANFSSTLTVKSSHCGHSFVSSGPAFDSCSCISSRSTPPKRTQKNRT